MSLEFNASDFYDHQNVLSILIKQLKQCANITQNPKLLTDDIAGYEKLKQYNEVIFKKFLYLKNEYRSLGHARPSNLEIVNELIGEK